MDEGGMGLNSMYTCECADGRTITGLSRWELADLKRMAPLELSKVLAEQRDFARYYEATFFYPIQSLKSEAAQLEQKYEQSKNLAFLCGAVAGVFTVLWLLMVLIPQLRFSGLTLLMAVLTLISILTLIPLLFRFISTQEDHAKRLPRIHARQRALRQQEEREIYGTYVEYLVGGYLISPEYCLYSEALELMIQALNSRRAANLSDATMLCKRKLGKSPVPRIVTALHSLTDATAPRSARQESRAKQFDLGQLPPQGPDIQAVLHLSEYLHTALKDFAANQRAPSDSPGSISSTLTQEEEALIAEYRYLKDDEKKRIRRVVHSFHTNVY